MNISVSTPNYQMDNFFSFPNLVKLFPFSFILVWIMQWIKGKITRRVIVHFPDRHLNSHSITDIRYEIIELNCPWSDEIKCDDFRVPIKINFNQHCKLESYSLKDKSGWNIKPIINFNADNKFIEIEPLRLIKGDKFSIEIKYSGLLYPATLQGKIHNGEIEADSQWSRYRKSSKLYLFPNLFLYTLWIVIHVAEMFGIVIMYSFSINLIILIGLILLIVLMELHCHSLDNKCSKVTNK